jgi:hypothetical protein
MKKAAFILLIIFLTFASAFAQKKTDASKKTGESAFIAAFGLSETSGGTHALLSEVAEGKIDKIGSGGTEFKTEIGGRVFLTRRWDVEIGEFAKDYSSYDLDVGIKDVIQKRLKKEGFKFKPLSKLGGLYSINYELGTTVGSIDLRSVFDEKSELHLFFIFHESYVIKRSGRK